MLATSVINISDQHENRQIMLDPMLAAVLLKKGEGGDVKQIPRDAFMERLLPKFLSFYTLARPSVNEPELR